MRVGIYSYYTRSENTAAAMHLADTLQDLGADLSWLAPPGSVAGVHPKWDLIVESQEDIPVRRWTQDLDTVIWFAFDALAASLAAVNGKQSLKQIRVLTHPCLSSPAGFAMFDKIVVPSTHPEVLASMQDHLDGLDTRHRIFSCPWTTGIARTEPVVSSTPTLLIYCDGPTWREVGHVLVPLVLKILKASEMDEWNVCLAYDDSASFEERILRNARARSKDRLITESQPSLDRLQLLFKSADRVVLPGSGQESSLFATWADASGASVIRMDSVPARGKDRVDPSMPSHWKTPARLVELNFILLHPQALYDAILKSCTTPIPRVPAPPEDSAAFNNFWRKAVFTGRSANSLKISYG